MKITNNLQSPVDVAELPSLAFLSSQPLAGDFLFLGIAAFFIVFILIVVFKIRQYNKIIDDAEKEIGKK